MDDNVLDDAAERRCCVPPPPWQDDDACFVPYADIHVYIYIYMIQGHRDTAPPPPPQWYGPVTSLKPCKYKHLVN